MILKTEDYTDVQVVKQPFVIPKKWILLLKLGDKAHSSTRMCIANMKHTYASFLEL